MHTRPRAVLPNESKLLLQLYLGILVLPSTIELEGGQNRNSYNMAPNKRVQSRTHVWQHVEIRFDAKPKDLVLRRGEVEVDSINSVEDTKGNNTGVRGSLVVTNLRVLWISHRDSKVNLSIGYDCVTTLGIKNVNSRLRGLTQALHVMTKFQGSRFEFIFTSLVKSSPRLFTTCQTVYRAYDTSRIYRDLKLRGALVHGGTLALLPGEEVHEKIDGVSNLSTDQGNLGIFFITNVRVVWFAKLAENFNVSIPFLQMEELTLRQSRFGLALVVRTLRSSGGFILGFRTEPPEAQQELFDTLQRLHTVYTADPVLGVRYTVEDTPKTLSQLTVPRVRDDIEIVEEDVMFSGNYEAYLDNSAMDHASPEYNMELGLAMMPLPNTYTVERLWHGNA